MHPSNLRRTQRSEESEGSVDLEYPNNGGMYVPNRDGVTTWFTGDIYSTSACWCCWPNTTPCPHSSSSARIAPGDQTKWSNVTVACEFSSTAMRPRARVAVVEMVIDAAGELGLADSTIWTCYAATE